MSDLFHCYFYASAFIFTKNIGFAGLYYISNSLHNNQTNPLESVESYSTHFTRVT